MDKPVDLRPLKIMTKSDTEDYQKNYDTVFGKKLTWWEQRDKNNKGGD